MGQTLSQMRILVVGLDGAGKTSLLYKLQIGKIVTTIPTIGFHVKKVEDKNTRYTAWDVGGRDMDRHLVAWSNYCHDTQQGIIFVVDSNDRDRIAEARDALHRILKQDELLNAVLLVFANKQDLPNAMSAGEITDKLGLLPLRRRYWGIYYCCATTGDGLYDGLDWLSKSICYKFNQS